MKPVPLAILGSLWAIAAWAQNAPIQSSPLPPLQQQWQREGSPPVQQAPTGPRAPSWQPPGAAAPDNQQANAPPPVPVEKPNLWLPAGAAKLSVLDKVNAQATTLTVKVGQSATFASMTVTVKACMIRPPDQPPDASAFLSVTDSHPDSPGFDGWMLQNEPSVSMMQSPIYDIRVTGCA